MEGHGVRGAGLGLHHAAHATHAAHSSHAAHAAAHAVVVVMAAVVILLFLGQIGDERFGSEKQGRDAGCILQGDADDLRRVDDAGRD